MDRWSRAARLQRRSRPRRVVDGSDGTESLGAVGGNRPLSTRRVAGEGDTTETRAGAAQVAPAEAAPTPPEESLLARLPLRRRAR